MNLEEKTSRAMRSGGAMLVVKEDQYAASDYPMDRGYIVRTAHCVDPCDRSDVICICGAGERNFSVSIISQTSSLYMLRSGNLKTAKVAAREGRGGGSASSTETVVFNASTHLVEHCRSSAICRRYRG